MVNDGTIDIIVPDYIQVLSTLTKLNPNDQTASEFNRDMINIHTEVFNEPSDPHLSIWTKDLARYYFELEGFWKITKLDQIELDGRNWYLHIIAHKK